MRVHIIGGGLAGCALAYTLRHAGLRPVIYEAGNALAGQASGNPVGLYNPRFSAILDAQALYYKTAFARALETFSTLEHTGWIPCGALHLMTDDKKARRFLQTVQNWGWSADRLRLLSAQGASRIAGIALSHDALYMPEAGTISPPKLCAAYTKNVEIRLNTTFTEEDFIKYETHCIIISGGVESHKFTMMQDIPLTTIRGQISRVRETNFSKNLSCALCYGGYITPAQDGLHTLGATFQPWLDHTDIRPQDDTDNIASLAAISPEMANDLSPQTSRAGIRLSTKDHFPVVGRLPDHQNIYISTAHGSHGILSSLMAAQLLSEMILGTMPSLPAETLRALSPERFGQTLS